MMVVWWETTKAGALRPQLVRCVPSYALQPQLAYGVPQKVLAAKPATHHGETLQAEAESPSLAVREPAVLEDS